MTPDELRALADEATPVPFVQNDHGGPVYMDRALVAKAKLEGVAPDLARLCAELGEALAYMTGIATELNDGDPLKAKLAIQANDALAKLSELEAR